MRIKHKYNTNTLDISSWWGSTTSSLLTDDQKVSPWGPHFLRNTNTKLCNVNKHKYNTNTTQVQHKYIRYIQLVGKHHLFSNYGRPESASLGTPLSNTETQIQTKYNTDTMQVRHKYKTWRTQIHWIYLITGKRKSTNSSLITGNQKLPPWGPHFQIQKYKYKTVGGEVHL